MKKPSEILGELAGHASLCWEPRPTGVFDSSEAQKAVDSALDQYSAWDAESLLTESEVEKAVIKWAKEQEAIDKFGDIRLECDGQDLKDIARAIVKKMEEKEAE